MKATVNVELQRACDVASLPDLDDIRGWIEAAIRWSNDEDGRACDIVVRVVDEQESRDLNNRFRHKDKATNVLAFAAADSSAAAGRPRRSRRTLGDLAICGPVVEREAREQGKSAAGHWGHLLIHGTLHLLGHDHRTAEEAAEMERLETRILADRGFADPYA
ncbi:MAG: rRNA maturation RNase YbeY [Woeseia sp.]